MLHNSARQFLSVGPTVIAPIVTIFFFTLIVFLFVRRFAARRRHASPAPTRETQQSSSLQQQGMHQGGNQTHASYGQQQQYAMQQQQQYAHLQQPMIMTIPGTNANVNSTWPHTHTLVQQPPVAVTVNKEERSEQLVNELPDMVLTKENLNQTCPICLESLSDRPVTAGGCLHIMHRDCLQAWLVKDEALTCPICRLPLVVPEEDHIS